MKNILGREVPQGYQAFSGSNEYKKVDFKRISEKKTSDSVVMLSSYAELFDKLAIKDGMTLSFHHHLRNGDYVLNSVCEQIKQRNLKDMNLAPSSIFPNNACSSRIQKLLKINIRLVHNAM